MIGIIAAAFTLAAIIMRSITGIILDKCGRKGVFMAGLLVMTVVTAVYGFVASMGLILAVRLLHGIGWGMASTSANTVASDMIPKDQFAEGMGYFALSNSLGMAIGPFIGLAILNHFNYISLFGFAVGTLVFTILIIIFLSMKKASDLPKKEKEKPTFIEKSALTPTLTMFFISMTYGALTGFLSLYGSQQGVSNIGIYFAVYAMTLFFTRPIVGRICDKKGYNFGVYPGLIFIFTGLIVLGKATSLPIFLVSAAIYGIGIGASQSALQAMAVVNAPKEKVGAANATYLIGFDAGIGAGSIVSGLIASSFGYGNMYIAISAATIVSGLFFFISMLNQQRHSKPRK